MKSRIASTLAALLWATTVCCSVALAQISQTINYQGYLTSPSGAAINNPSVSMVFKLYDAVTGGTVLHTETQTVAVSNGIFNVVLGTTTALTASFAGPYWLGVAVGGDAEMSPRQPLAASPYALRAANADALAASATVTGSQITGAISTATLPAANLTGTLTTAQIADASVTAAKLASNGCTGGQVLQYNGSAWVCATPAASSGGTVTSISAGTGLTGGTITTTGTIGLGTVPVANGGTGLVSAGTAGNLLRSTGSAWASAPLQVTDVPSLSANYINNSATLQAPGTFNISGNGLIGGNLGIGTSNPFSKLHVFGYGIANGIDLGDRADNPGTNSANIYLTPTGNGILSIVASKNGVGFGNVALQEFGGKVGIGTANPLVPLHVTPGTAKTNTTNTRAFAILTNEPLGPGGDPNNPFGLDVRLIGGATLANRSVYIQTTDFDTAGGGNMLLQPGGGNVGIGVTSPGSKLTVAGTVESTSGGVKFPDGTTQTTAAPTVTGLSNSAGNSRSTVDSGGTVGRDTSITLGADGLPVISYYDVTNQDLKVAKCSNPACTGASTLTTVDSVGNVGFNTSITLGADGLPVISYHDATNGDLKVAKCSNPACTGASTLTTVDSGGFVGGYTSITLGADGLPVISYFDSTNGDLKVAKCSNPACTGASTLTTVDSGGGSLVGGFTSITLGADGLPVISYYDVTNFDLKVAKCSNPACTGASTLTTVDSVGDVGYYSSITLGADGLPVISYYDVTNFDLKVAKCSNPACTGASTLTTVDSVGDVGYYSSITLGADGLPVISYYDATNGRLKVAKCSNPACTGASTLTTVDSGGNVGLDNSITLGADGLPVISYYDQTNGDLKVAKCSSATCVPFVRRR